MKRIIALCLCALSLLLLWAPRLAANAAEPPNIVVYLQGEGAAELTLELVMSDGSTRAPATQWTAWERKDSFSSLRHEQSLTPRALRATVRGEAREYDLAGLYVGEYNTFLTLDVSAGTLSAGISPLRTTLLIAMRLVITLLIEGALFFAFGYRQKRSWLVFVAVNLITQGLLNLWIGSVVSSYMLLFSLFFFEVLILIAELCAMLPLVKEHRRPRTAAFVALANVLSLVLGGIMITYLPI